jgi:hypothetical protein
MRSLCDPCPCPPWPRCHRAAVIQSEAPQVGRRACPSCPCQFGRRPRQCPAFSERTRARRPRPVLHNTCEPSSRACAAPRRARTHQAQRRLLLGELSAWSEHFLLWGSARSRSAFFPPAQHTIRRVQPRARACLLRQLALHVVECVGDDALLDDRLQVTALLLTVTQRQLFSDMPTAPRARRLLTSVTAGGTEPM